MNVKVTAAQRRRAPPATESRSASSTAFTSATSEVIEGADTVLTFEPHPLSVIHPEAAPKLIMPFHVKRDVIEGLGVDELVVIPFDKEFASIAPEEFCTRILVETLGARAGLGGGELPLRRQGQGDSGDARLPRRIRDDRGAARRGRRRDRLLDPDPGAGRGGRRRHRTALPRLAVHVRGRGRLRRQARADARVPDREHRSRRALRLPGLRDLRGFRERTSRPPSTSASGRPSRAAAAC